MRFSVMIWPHSDVDVAPVVRLAQQADALGYDIYYVGDSQMIWNDAWVALAMCAAGTERIGLGTGVTNTVTRHPAVTANAAMTLNMVSNGRAVLGVGAGDSAVRTAGLNPHKLPAMKAAVEFMGALLRGQEVDAPMPDDVAAKPAWGVERRIRIAGTERWGNVPIHTAVMGPKSAAAVAEVSEGVIVDGHMGGNGEGARRTCEAVAEGEQRAGKDPGSVRVIAALQTAIDDDRSTALDECRATAARTIARKQYLPDTIGVEHADVVAAVTESYKFYKHLDLTAAHRKLIPDEVAMKTTMGGTPQDCIDKVRELEEAGITDIALEITSQNEENARVTLDRFATEVIPNL
ncbi:MAG: LLM class flavin-dependent oxidoreductase [Solirubrobacteraceae bacterium]